MSIATEIARLQTAKSDLKTAIEGKGVTVPSTTTLDGYADLVDAISGGGSGDVTVTSLDVAVNGTYTAPTGTAYSPVVVNVQSDIEIKTIVSSISNTKELFDMLVPSPQANKTYVIAEYELQDNTLYNGISFLLAHTNASGGINSPSVGIRYRSGNYNTCAIATNYDAAVTVGDKYSVRCY